MPVQGGNTINHNTAYAGMIADGQLSNRVSKLNKTDALIKAGLGLFSDGDDAAKLPEATSAEDTFVGFVVREIDRTISITGDGADNIKRDMTILTVGTMWVEASVAVAKDDPVFVIVGDGTANNASLGKVSNVVGAGATTAIEISGAKFISSADAGKLAKISLKIGG